MRPMIRVDGLVKRFGPTTALAGVDLAVPAGRVVGVLGPNGAGKTTMVRVLATLLRPDAGTVQVGGLDVVRDAGRVRRLIGLTGQYAGVDGDLSGVENLVLLGRLLGMARRAARLRADELLARFELTEWASRPSRTYSGGLRRRLDLAASLVGRPEVLFLDEPTTGLDPHVRRELWQLVRELVADGVTVMLTTQYLEEADQLAHRITVFDRGRVVGDGSPDELKRRIGGHTVEVRPAVLTHMGAVAEVIERVTGAAAVQDVVSGRLTVPVGDPDVLAAVARALHLAGIEVAELALRLPSLDEVFLALTGKPALERVAVDGRVS
ncbi:MAG TPA: ATP-binding cassette domain-containing protein [Kutzneria sp.]|nr:ATP-binding cassette domain-containing protein [Kutzneria sp.]